jgi:hypothetical protein
MTILEREGVMLIADALVGMPFADSDRERQIQAGPRGLGVAIGLGVDDLESTYQGREETDGLESVRRSWFGADDNAT